MKIRYLLPLLFFSSLNLCSQSLFPEGVSKDLLLGKVNYEQDERFVKVAAAHASKPLYLNKEVYAAFTDMFQAAKKDGISLRILSGARNFDHQKAIWERKWKSHAALDPRSRTSRILEFSSMPATSRHHWGTDIDLNNLENEYFESGKGKKEYEWLVNNAHRFGFYQVYDSKEAGRTGYSEEKWHWSYLPLAGPYLKFYNENIGYYDISGFDGAYLARIHKMITAYVNGIAAEIRDIRFLPKQDVENIVSVDTE